MLFRSLTPLEDRLKEVEEDFAAKKKDLEKRHADSLAAIERDLEAKIAELGEEPDEDEKKEIEEANAKRRQELVKSHEEALAALGPDKEKAAAEAKKEFEADQTKGAQKVEECVSKAADEGVTQSVAQCRIEAESTDAYWNQCR